MPIISSHILDSISGQSAVGIRVQLFRLVPGATGEVVFDLVSNNEGRVMQQVEVLDFDSDQEFELVFHSTVYFSTKLDQSTVDQLKKSQNMDSVVVRFRMANREQKYHIPLVLSPHSYTVWWSE